MRLAYNFQKYAEKIVTNQVMDLERYASKVMAEIKKNMMMFLNNLYLKEGDKSVKDIASTTNFDDIDSKMSKFENLKQNIRSKMDSGFEPIKFMYSNGTPIRQYQWFANDNNNEKSPTTNLTKPISSSSTNIAKFMNTVKSTKHNQIDTFKKTTIGAFGANRPSTSDSRKSKDANSIKSCFDNLINANLGTTNNNYLNTREFTSSLRSKANMVDNKKDDKATIIKKLEGGKYSFGKGYKAETPKLSEITDK